MRVLPPRDEAELLTRARGLAGRPLGWVAAHLGVDQPVSLARRKGWAGQLLELALGASAGSRAEPDFPALGIELKSIPTDAAGVPWESTWVTGLALDQTPPPWERSRVREKLARVLWIPLVGGRGDPGASIGAPLVWSPAPDEEATLRRDYDELVELVACGRLDALHAGVGEALQVRPKAASGRSATWALDDQGEWRETRPRGFYLRRTFTAGVLRRLLAG